MGLEHCSLPFIPLLLCLFHLSALILGLSLLENKGTNIDTVNPGNIDSLGIKLSLSSSFFLEFFLHSSPVAYWVPTDLGISSFSVISFCLFILIMGFSRHKYWSGFPFPSPVDHVLSELSTTTHPSWMALHGMAHSFIELDKAVWSLWSVWLVSYNCGFHSVCPLMDKDKKLSEASWWEGLAVSCSDGQGHAH